MKCLLSLLLVLSGCAIAPVVSYEHVSDPSVSGDGFDLVCGGAKARENDFTAALAYCKDLHYSDANLVRINLEWSPL